MKQQTLAMANGFERYTKKTRRTLFLEEMEQVVPWAELCALVEPVYAKAGNGRPPVGAERMLRMYFLQHASASSLSVSRNEPFPSPTMLSGGGRSGSQDARFEGSPSP